ncbi:hypothetical protein B0H11DRAFT_2279441 [Mycena galericulata]|nr:hypothetical protein B0H11DRAFT_2279441 [Mycena galericulata]
MSSELAMPHPVYGHHPRPSQSSLSTFSVSSFSKEQLADGRGISRTPSPTPSEYNALHGIKEQKTTKQKIQYYVILAVILTLAVLLSVYNKKIVNALKPVTDWLHNHEFGPLIPIVLLIIVSFPPLFGQEIIATLVGVTWSLPEAFLIVSIGTLLGEIANFFTFKYCCSARTGKIEAKNLDYGLLAHVVRKGGFLVIIVIRYSAVPSHFATAVFATLGVSFWIFLAAAVLSLPNIFVPVYAGYVMQPGVDKTSAAIENIVLIAGIIITVVAYMWIQRQMKSARPEFIYARRKARQAEMEASSGPHYISMPEVV